MSMGDRHWWHSATVYEVYPSSFKDSNDDGTGDLVGLISQVPYIASLGIDAVWLAACCKSGGIDNGYDVIDYREIDAQFGTFQDIETLIAELGKHDIKLIMDLVVNHTSSHHKWFKESQSSRSSEKRDWYIWRPGRPGGLPPNNWKSCFEGPAWTYNEDTDEWYLHMFSSKQPDLNWTNPDVRNAIYDDMRFWLSKGIGGFRMDVINIISKPAGLPMAGDATKELQSPLKIVCNQPAVHEYLRELRREVLDQYGDIVSVGEIICTGDVDAIRQYTDPRRRELSMAYTFELFALDIGGSDKFSRRDWKFIELKNRVKKWQQGLQYSSGHWQTLWLESHDSARSVTRFGDGTEENRWKIAKMLALLQSTLSGTMFLYQGQEIAMKNLTADVPIAEYQDLETHALMKAGLDKGRSQDEVRSELLLKARDHARAPMPWSAATTSDPYAGFSANKPWSPMNTDSSLCNVASQRAAPDSILRYWQKRIKLRKQHADALIFGDFEPLESTMDDSAVFAYWKKPVNGPGHERCEAFTGASEKQEGPTPLPERTREVLVVINLSNREHVRFMLPRNMDNTVVPYMVLDDTYCAGEQHSAGALRSGGMLELAAYEGIVLGSP
ncbi:Oligo-1,6-glucosidase [Fulvia fulva]|nr:Oligo-1,6-glucosidase [Fulvia fulva]KAK4625112.1 Oligo-1,6-glucosidase [Fulvia fulva]WPV15552.1 Oligo-1,6-glucosidase [Fulvia fulva]WPV30530.1 Oligo-1,6-glucosidase [Fulvia fulva]